MTRIGKRFAELSRAGEMGLVAYITAGDPTLDATRQIVLAAAEAGADIIELGVPFSDPLADGPTIQRASERALRAGATLAGVLELVAAIRKESQVPLSALQLLQSDFADGAGEICRACRRCGSRWRARSPTLRPRKRETIARRCTQRGLDTVFLAAPTTSADRFPAIAAASSGFLYLVSRTGVTGARESLPQDLPALVRRARQATSLPVAIGFGISLPGHISVLGRARGRGRGRLRAHGRDRARENAHRSGRRCGRADRLLKRAAGKGISRREPGA